MNPISIARRVDSGADIKPVPGGGIHVYCTPGSARAVAKALEAAGHQVETHKRLVVVGGAS